MSGMSANSSKRWSPIALAKRCLSSGVDRLGEDEVVLVDEFVFKDMPRGLTVIGNADPVLHWPPRDNIGPDATLDVLVSEHVEQSGPVDDLHLQLDAHFFEINPQGIGHLRALRLSRVGERQELELHAAGIASLLQELFGSGRVVAVLLLEPLLPFRVPALGDG